MKNIIKFLFLITSTSFLMNAQSQKKLKSIEMNKSEVLKTQSRIPNLNIAISHLKPNVISNDYPILFIHGGTFPTELAFGFKMNGKSWMDNLAENGFDVYALDFLGYGNSDRYPEMKNSSLNAKVVGSAQEIYLDIDKAVNLIKQKTGKTKVNLIAHSWGGSVASLYATKFPEKVAKLVLFASVTERNDNSTIEVIKGSYESLTPKQRVDGMIGLTPKGRTSPLEKEVLETWGEIWKKSDPLTAEFKTDSIRFPSGPSEDMENLLHKKSYFNPAEIKASTLIIRGEWDQYPNNVDAELLFSSLTNTPTKKYVVIEKGTHVMHLEKSRLQLYDETLHFLKTETNNMKANNHSIAVIFEVIPGKNEKQEYLDIAANLKPELSKIKGFISIERFQSLVNPEKILSLSFWENEEAIQEWRNLEMHRNAQAKGRNSVFKDYHLRIAQVIRDYGMFDRNEAPNDSQNYHK